jgi:hypothetical protein
VRAQSARMVAQNHSDIRELGKLPNSWSQNTRGGIPFAAFSPTLYRRMIAKKDLLCRPSSPTHEKPARLTPSSSIAALHFFRTFFTLAEISPAFATSSKKHRVVVRTVVRTPPRQNLGNAPPSDATSLANAVSCRGDTSCPLRSE